MAIDNRTPILDLRLPHPDNLLQEDVDRLILTLGMIDSLLAPLASPALTGNPTAPTQSQADNSTRIATTAYVKAAVAALINSAPGALDTLVELANALGNDANFATTVTNALALKAPLASPALTGTPTAPTAAGGTNTTQIATTAFVQAVKTALDGVDATKAPLASPVLTGTPTAPTAAGGTNTDQIATTAFVQAVKTALEAADATKAPLASPALTGTPTAPTAAGGTNTTQIASTAFVQAAIAALVASSPAALDTLNELAAALGNDPNFATTVTNALASKQPNLGFTPVQQGTGVGQTSNTVKIGWSAGAKLKATVDSTDLGNVALETWVGNNYAPLASPALTGNPTAPTPAAGDNDTSVATTAFVQGEISSKAPLASPTFTGTIGGSDLNLTGAATMDTLNATQAILSQGVYPGNTEIGNAYRLDWYEEGTFTPTVVGTTSAGVGTYNGRVGRFTRIGNIVHINILLGWTAHSGTGFLRIDGLPFMSSSSQHAMSVYYDGLTAGASKQLVARTTASATNMFLYACDPSGGAATSLSMDSAVTSLVITGTYFCP